MNALEHINTEMIEEVINGNGHCQASGCGCSSFVDVPGTWPNCERCGHQFSEHY